MKYTKLVSLGAALALAAALFTGCGRPSSSPASSSPSSAAAPSSTAAAVSGADLDAAFDSLLAANPISNQFTIADMNIQYDFLLDPADVAAYKGVKSNDNGDAGLVLVLQPAEGKAQVLCETLKTYQDDQVAYYGNYAEFAQAQANVRSAVISGRDGLVVMVIASNECPDAAALSSAVDAVLVS